MTSEWLSAPLTDVANGVPADGPPVACVTDFPDGGGARVVYAAQDGHVWELYCPRSTHAWSSADLTKLGGGARAWSSLAAYVTDFPEGGGARVVYSTQDHQDFHVWELYCPRSTLVWSGADLSDLAGGAPAGRVLASYVTDFPDGGGARVVYAGQDGRVWELYCPRSTHIWSITDLTSVAGGPPATGQLAGYATDFPDDGGARVVYTAQDGHVWELYCAASTHTWSSADLTKLAEGPAERAPSAGELAACVTDFPDGGGARVVYAGQDGHVWELYCPRSTHIWSITDLTNLAKGTPGAPVNGPVTAYVTDFPDKGGARVVYRGVDDRIWELYLPA